MKRLYIFCFLFFIGCQKESILVSTNASDVFYVENEGAAMRVFVEGNTASRLFILIIHGGPGVSSYFYDTKYISANLGDKYAMVYWDQRNAGASQGSNNGKDLHLGIMVEDLKKVIEVLKFRYGQDISLFLVGHSFGGLIAADFVTTPGYQQLIKGLINVDGSHNYPLNDTLTRDMLLSYGKREISLKRNENKWVPIFNYCFTHQGGFSEDESMQLEKYAGDAENLIDSVKKVNITSFIFRYSITDVYPLTAIVSNLLYSEDSKFNKELAVTQFSSLLNTVTIPVLVLWGKYDFTCPLPLGEDFYNRVHSVNKRFVISPVSGHNMILQDKKLFCDEVSTFVSKYR